MLPKSGKVHGLSFRWFLALSLLHGPALAAPGAHAHGVVRLEVAAEGNRLAIALQAPLDSLLGFERAPRSQAERAAGAAVLARFHAPAGLFVPSPAASCVLEGSEVHAPVLEGKGQGDGHAELEAELRFVCAHPDRLTALEVGLFSAYPRIRRAEAQVVGPQGQHKASITPRAPRLPLSR